MIETFATVYGLKRNFKRIIFKIKIIHSTKDLQNNNLLFINYLMLNNISCSIFKISQINMNLYLQ